MPGAYFQFNSPVDASIEYNSCLFNALTYTVPSTILAHSTRLSIATSYVLPVDFSGGRVKGIHVSVGSDKRAVVQAKHPSATFKRIVPLQLSCGLGDSIYSAAYAEIECVPYNDLSVQQGIPVRQRGGPQEISRNAISVAERNIGLVVGPVLVPPATLRSCSNCVHTWYFNIEKHLRPYGDNPIHRFVYLERSKVTS